MAEAIEPWSRIVDLDLWALTRQGLDTWVACVWDARPPRGLAGLCDWRLHGLICRELRQGRVKLDAGEVTLIGASRRLSGARLALVGLGSRVAPAAVRAELARAAQLVTDLVRRLGCRRVAVEIPVDPNDPALADPVGDPERTALVTALQAGLGGGGEGGVERLVLVESIPTAS